METKRIDQYICIDTDQIIIDEMRLIIESNNLCINQEDRDNWKRLQEAAKVILENYTVQTRREEA